MGCDFYLAEDPKSVGKSEESSFLERLLGNVLKNFEVSITNIHIRYEDFMTKPDSSFAAGITLKEFTIHVRVSFLLSASLTLVKEALIEIGCVMTSLVVGRWLSYACTVAKRCILGL